MKIGIVNFGSGVRGLVSEEESSSNAAIIEAPYLRYLIEKLNATLYIIGPVQKKTKDIIEGKYPELWKPYLKNVVICTGTQNEPESLDLITVGSGAENMRFTGIYNNGEAPCGAWVYRALKKYPNAPVLYFQTDFGSPLWLPESYGGFFMNKFPSFELFKNRNLYVLCAGTNGSEEYARYFSDYKMSNFIKLVNVPPDLHFFIDLEDLDYKFSGMYEHITGVAFAGKDRRVGSRAGSLQSYLSDSDPSLNFTLAGKWKEEAIAELKAANKVNFNYIGALPTHKDVCSLYNKTGATLYLSSDEYSRCGTVTSRFYDAIHSNAIPLINETDSSAILRAWPGISDEVKTLSVNPKTIKSKLVELDSLETRRKIMGALRAEYYKNRSIVLDNFGKILDKILSIKPNNTEIKVEMIAHSVSSQLKKSRNRAKTMDEAIKMSNDELKYWHSLEGCPIMGHKMQMGLYFDYPSKEVMDVPSDIYNARLRSITE